MSTRKVGNLPVRKTREVKRQVVTNPAKGLNNLGSPNLIDDKEWADLQNIEFDEGGVARKRMGYTTFATSLTAPRGLGNLKTETVSHVCTIDDTAFKYTTGSSWTTVGTVSFTAGLDVAYTQAKGKLFIWNRTNGGTYWDGAALARPGTMPKGGFSIYYSSFHIVAGVPGQVNRIYISTLSDITDFTNAATTLMDSTEVPGATVFAGTGANYIDIQREDGDEITGLGVFQDVVIIYKKYATYQMTLDATGAPTVVPITKAAGCVAPNTVQAVENDLFSLSMQGVRSLGNEANFFSAIRTNILTKKIDRLIQGMKPSDYDKAVAIFFKNSYLLSIPNSSGVLDTVIVYNKLFQCWTKWTDLDIAAFCKIVDTDNNERLLFLKEGGTQVYEFTPDIYNDNGAAINAYMVSKVFDFKNPDITKYFVDLGLMFRTISGEMTLTVYTEGDVLFGGAVGLAGNTVNDGMGYSMLGYAMFGTAGGDDSGISTYADIVKRIAINTNSTTIRFKIENARVNENFVLLGYIHAFYPYGHYLFDSSNKIYL